jgi:hypothetical protein
LSGGEYAAHDDFLYIATAQAGALYGGFNGGSAEFGGGDSGEITLKTTHRGAGYAGDDNRVMCIVHDSGSIGFIGKIMSYVYVSVNIVCVTV